MPTPYNVPKNTATPTMVPKFAVGGYGYARYGMSDYK
jgi:hypothetical protein